MKKLKQAVSYVLVFLTVFSSFTILPSEFFHSAAVYAAELLTEDSSAETTTVTSATGYTDSTGSTNPTSATTPSSTWPDYVYCTGPTFYGESFIEGDFEYSLINNDTELQVVSYVGEDTDIVIPSEAIGTEHEEIAGKKVTAIAQAAFYYDDLTSVTLPDTIKIINSHVFYENYNLTEVNLSECTNLVYIGYNAFQGTAITNLTLPASLQAMGGDVFYDCNSLTTVDMSQCTKIESLKSGIFSYCQSLKSVLLPTNIQEIPERMFSSCSFTELDLSQYKELTYIGYNAFAYNEYLENIIFPDSLYSIGYNAFTGCASLKSVDIPASVVYIESDAFMDCTALESFNVSQDNEYYTSVDGVLFNKDKTTLMLYPSGKSGKYVVPAGVTKINDSAFNNCDGLTVVDLSKCANLEYIGDNAFNSCSNIETIDFSQCPKLSYIGEGVFYDCINLETVNFEKCTNLETIGNRAFQNTAVSSLELPESIKTIDNGAFSSCSKLTIVNFEECTNLETIGDSAFYNCDSLTEIDLSNCTNLSAIEYNAFGYCDGLESVDLSNCTSLESAGSYLFYYCKNLKTVNMSGCEKLQSLPYGMFYNCSALTSVNFSGCAKLSSINNNAFYNCTNLATLDLSNCTSLASISSSMLSSCSNLQNVNLSGCSSITSIPDSMFSGRAQLTTVTLPSTVTSIGSKAFYNCSKLSAINLSECTNLEAIGGSAFYNCAGLTSIDFSKLTKLSSVSSAAFLGCSGLQSVDLSKCTKLTAIPSSMFSGCSQLTTVTLPSTVTGIGGSAFNSCTKLSKVNLSECAKLQTIDSNAFYGCSSLIALNLSKCENLQTINSYAFANCTALKTANLSNCSKLSSVNSYAFSGSTALTELNLSNCTSLTSISDSVLSNSGGLVSLNLSNTGITSISNYAFQDCTSLSAIDLSGCVNLASIGGYAFEDCTSLTTVDLSVCVNLASIGGYAFEDCTSLTTVDLSGCTSLSSVNSYAFWGCSSLTSVDLSGCTSLSSVSSYAFWGRSSLTSVDLSSCTNLTTIYYNAFYNCSGLNSIILPESLTTIGSCAFYKCTSLNVVQILSKNVSSISSDSFSGCTPTFYCYENSTTHTTLKNLGFTDIKFITGKVENLATTYLSSNTATIEWEKPYGPYNTSHYIIYKDGEKLTETDDTKYTAANLTLNQEYVFAVVAVYKDSAMSEQAEITVKPNYPTIDSITLPNNSDTVGGLEKVKLTATMSDSISSKGGKGVFMYAYGALKEGEEMEDEAWLEATDWYYACDAQQVSGSADFVGYWDLTDLTTGDYCLKFVFTGKEGDTSTYYRRANVDRTHPGKIDEPMIIPAETSISIAWQVAREATTTGYRVYRMVDNSGEYSLIATLNDRETTSYKDTNVVKDKIYSYYVVAIDEFGQESLTYDVVSAGLIDDVVPPSFTKMTPISTSYIYRSTRFRVYASDNVGVTKTELYYSYSLEDDKVDWNLLTTSYGSTLNKYVDTTVMNNGVVYVRAKIYDAMGNYAYSPSYQYMCDNQGPEKVTGVECIQISGANLTLAWNDVSDDDISYFYIERLQSNGTYTRVQTAYSTLGANLSGLTPETEYTFRVVGYDKHGNRGTESDPITVTTTEDTQSPAVTSFYPSYTYYNGNINLEIVAQDDYQVKSLKLEASTDNESWQELTTLEASSFYSSYKFYYTLDTTQFDEGSLFVRATVTDTYGNETEEDKKTCYEYIVDRTPAKLPTEFTASSDDDYVCLQWSGMETDSSFRCFKLYRCATEDGEYNLIASSLTTLNYYDTRVEYGEGYYYKISTYDKAGNESELSEAVFCKVKEDEEAPVIYGISPSDGSAIGKINSTVNVLAVDNARVGTLKVEYMVEGLFSSYTTLREVTDNSTASCQVSVDLPIDDFADGATVIVKATATDKAGNVAQEKTVTYTVDKTAPTVNNLTVTEGEDKKFTLKWQADSDNDTVCYYVYRQLNQSGEYILYSSVTAVTGQTEYTFTDTVTDNTCTAVQYKVEAYDKVENSSSVETDVFALEVDTRPIVNLSYKNSIIAESEYIYDASSSTDNGTIVSYEFDFGNGDVVDSTNGQVTYAYQESGTYTLTVTATDNDGEFAKLERTIKVNTRDLANTITITVVDDNNSTVNNAPVYIDLGEEGEQKGYTDYYGQVTFDVAVGTHTVASYKDGYLPVKNQIVVTSGQTYTQLVLVKQPIVTGTFEIHKMTFEEIKAANIDINAAENRNVVKFEVRLNYSSQPIDAEFYWNGVDVFYEEKIVTNEKGEERSLTPSVVSMGEDKEPLVVYVDVPVEMSYVKEFFDVSLHIVNNATEDFKLVNNTVTLNVPDGLTIMDLEGYQRKVATIPEIKGQSQKTLNWIVRGDKAGEYEISADFLGTLDYFNEPVKATFISDEPIVVEGTTAVKATVETCKVTLGSKVLYNVVIENIGESDLNGFYWKNLEEPYGVEFEDTDGNRTIMKTQRDTLKPGEKFIYHYVATRYGYPYFQDAIITNLSESIANVDVKAYEAKYFTDFYYKIFPEESGKFIVYVKDSSGNAISGADVIIGETEMVTDEKGRAILEDRDIEGGILKVSKDGYYTYIEKDYYSFSTSKDDKVVLYKEGETALESVKVDDTNVLERKKTIYKGKVDDDKIKEKVNFDIIAFGNIESIAIKQNGKNLAVATENNGTENNYTITISTNSLESEKAIYAVVKAKDESGKEITISKELKLDAVFMPNLSHDQFPVIDSFNINIDEGEDDDGDNILKLLGGTCFNFAMKALPDALSIVYDADEEKFVCSFNLLADPEDDQSIKEYTDELHKLYETFKKTGKNPMKDDDNPVEIGFVGVIEIKVDDKGNYYVTKGSYDLSIEITVGFDKDFVVYVVPVTVGVEITGGASTGIGIEYDIDANKLNAIIGELALSAGLKLSAGIGVSCLSAGIYGSAEIEFNFDFKSDKKLKNILVGGELGLYAKAFTWDGELPIISKEDYQIWPKKKEDSKAKALSQAVAKMYSADSYSLNSKLFGYNAVWNAPILANSGTTTLVDNAYSYSAPQIITCGDNTIMVYLSVDKESENSVNAMTMYCSVYNKDTGKWGVPTKIDDNNQLDMSFTLCTDGEKIYLVYSQANTVFDDDATLENMTASGDIYTAVFDSSTKKFTEFTQLTNNSTFDCSPVVKTVNGVPTAVWVNNANNNTFLTDSDNSIMISTCENGVWSQPQAVQEGLNTVQNLSLVHTGKGTAIVYTTDGDCDLTTLDDKTLYCYYSKLDTTVEIDSELETAVAVQELVNSPVAVWYKDGVLKQYNLNTNTTEEICSVSEYVADGFKLVTDNNGNYAIVYVEDKSTVCAMYLDTVTLKWTKPVTVAASENYIENLEAQYVDGRLTLMYYDTEAVANEGTYNVTSKMVSTAIDNGARAVIDDVNIDLHKVVPSETAKADVTVTNTGAMATGDLTFTVTNYDGMNLGTYTTQGVSLASGETGTYQVEFLVPEYIVNRDITISVTDSGRNYTDSFNINLAKCDYSIKIEQLVEDDESYIYAEFTNSLYYSSPATIEVYNKKTDEVYYSVNTTGVPAGGKKAVRIPLDESYVDANRFVYVRIVPIAEDYLDYDNSDMCQIYQEKKEYDLSGITVNGTAIEDFTNDVTAYTVVVANTENVQVVPMFNNPTLTYQVTAENNVYTINMLNSKGENVGTYTVTVEEKQNDYAITGDIDLRLNKSDDSNLATGTVTLNSGSYKIKVNANGTELGYNKTVDDICSNLSFNANYSAYLTLNATGGDYTFIYNTTTNKLTVEYKGYGITGDIDLKLKKTGANTITATTTLENGSYKIKVDAKGTQLGYNKTINNICSNLSFSANYSAYLTLNATGGEYTFTFNTATNKLSVEYKGYGVTGDVNLQLKETGTNTVTGTANLENGSYKIKVNVNGTELGYNKTITNAYSNMSFKADYSAYMTLNATGGEYTFTLNTATNKLTIKHKGYGVMGDISLQLAEASNGTAVAETTLKAGSYKIKVSANGTEMGYNKVIDDISSGLTFNSTYSSYLTLNATGGKYTFILNTSTNKLVIKKDGICIMGDINLKLNDVSDDKAMCEMPLQSGSYKIKVNHYGTHMGYNKVVTNNCDGLSVNKAYTSYITFNTTGGVYNFIFDKSSNRLIIKKTADLPNAYMIGDLNTVLTPVKGKALAIGTAYLEANDYSFKLSVGGTELGYGKVVNDATTGSMSFNSNFSSQATLKATGGMYTFVLNTATNKLEIRHTPTVDESNEDVHISGNIGLVLNDKADDGTQLATATGTTQLEEGTYTFKVYNYGTVYTSGAVINDKATKNLSSKYTTAVTLNATGGTYKFTFNKETGALVVSQLS